MAYTLHQDGHIRVRILLNKLGNNKKWGERWCYGIGSVLAIYFFYYASRGAYFSYILNDISQQDDAWPMWIPQMVMVIGTLILAIAFLDRFYQSIFFKYEDLEETFQRFYSRIGQYNPRKYVEENLSYKASVDKLLEIFNAD